MKKIFLNYRRAEAGCVIVAAVGLRELIQADLNIMRAEDELRLGR